MHADDDSDHCEVLPLTGGAKSAAIPAKDYFQMLRWRGKTPKYPWAADKDTAVTVWADHVRQHQAGHEKRRLTHSQPCTHQVALPPSLDFEVKTNMLAIDTELLRTWGRTLKHHRKMRRKMQPLHQTCRHRDQHRLEYWSTGERCSFMRGELATCTPPAPVATTTCSPMPLLYRIL